MNASKGTSEPIVCSGCGQSWIKKVGGSKRSQAASTEVEQFAASYGLIDIVWIHGDTIFESIILG